MDRKETELDSRGRHLDSRTASPCDGRPDAVWTWILVCKYFLESPTHSGKSVCGQLLIRSILVMLFNFEVPLKKIIKKKEVAARKKIEKETKKSNNKEGALCVFSFLLCGGAL
jgi:hypothetical protein